MLSAVSKSAPYMSGVIGGFPSHCAPSDATAAGRKAAASRASSSAVMEGARRVSLAPAHAVAVQLPLIVARRLGPSLQTLMVNLPKLSFDFRLKI